MTLPTVDSAQLVPLILKLSATNEGFLFVNSSHLKMSSTLNSMRTRDLIKAGKVFRAKVVGHSARFFSTQIGALHFEATTLPQTETRDYRRKTPKPVVIAKKAVIARSAKPISALPKKATIFYPPGYKHTYHPMQAQRNQVVTHGFVHGGMEAM